MRTWLRHSACLALACAGLGCGSGASTAGQGTTTGTNGPTLFFDDPSIASGGLSRAQLGATAQKIALPKELGDNNLYLAVHFSSPRNGVALVGDWDGGAANVLTYDADKNRWNSVAFITNPEVIGHLPLSDSTSAYSNQRPNFPTVFARSWTDGSFVVAMAMTDAQFGQSVWSVTSIAGAAPVESVTPLATTNVPELDPSRQMYLNIVGAPTASQLNAVAFSAGGSAPAYAAYLSFDLLTGSVEAHDVAGVSGIFGGVGFEGDDYFVAEAAPGKDPTDADDYRITRYCREETCSSQQTIAVQHVEGFPYVVLGSSSGPVPWVKLGDLTAIEPTVRTIRLPTPSTELEFKSVLPDPQKPGTLRLVAYDSDVAPGAVEFRYDPATGAVTPLTSDKVSGVDACLRAPPYRIGCGAFSTEQFGVLSNVYFAFPAP